MASPSQKSLFAIPAPDLDHVLLRSSVELAELRGKSLFLTGGTGFFGKWLLAALCHADAQLSLGLRLTVLSRDPGKFLALHPEAAALDSLRFQPGDATDFPLTEARYDCILHAATDTLGIATAAQEEARARAIVDGTQRVLELARQCGAKRLLYVSSGGVYGAAAGKSTGASEDDAPSPQTPYARAKLEAEDLCEKSGLDFTAARAFAFLGPHLALDAHYAAGNFLRDAQLGRPILVRGDGTALRSYLHPADLVVWLLRILLRGRRARAYNVGSDEAVSTAQLARRIAGAVRPPLEVIIQSLQPQGPQNIYLPDIRRARSELNLDVAIPLDDAIVRTLAFLAYSET
jgi:dTDP-glucose 4,6-dehydratase